MASVNKDDWLSGLLGKPAYHLTGPLDALTQTHLPASPALIGAKVPVLDVDGLLKLQSKGFRVVDTNIQLSRKATSGTAISETVRFATTADEPAVRALAHTSFEHNRFHRDPQISDAIASRIKEEWAANYFAGKRGEWMLVAEHHGAVAGFLQLLRTDSDTLTIDLIAVAEQSRGQGLATAMIEHAASICLDRPANMNVGTQIANIISLNLYTRLGFGVVSAAYVLHLHI